RTGPRKFAGLAPLRKIMVEVNWLKPCLLTKTPPVENAQLSTTNLRAIRLSQRLGCAINGRNRKSDHLPDLGLAQRKRTGPARHSSHYPRTSELLTKEVCDPRQCAATAMDRNGLTEDHGINQSVSPERKTCGGRSFQQR